MRLILRILLALLAILVVLVIGLGVYGFFTARQSFPQVDGEVRLTGLTGPVDIYRDSYGVPQIYASNTHDLFFAQGYTHAQDRFWQMDFWRHMGSGRLSEMFGESQLETDQFLRTMGWARVVEQELQTIDPETKAILDAYADGVNAYLASHKGSQISLEYAVLGLLAPDYQVEPWTPLHSLTWAKAMSWELGGNMDAEITRARMLQYLTPEQVAELVPPYPSDMPTIVPSSAAAFSAEAAASQPALQTDLEPALVQLEGQMGRLEALLGPIGPEIGSNNWVIDGSRTASGLPILANDPHLAAQMPSIWYEIGLHCQPVGPDCPFNVTGFSFAGDPGVIVGHNDRIAWGVTNVGPDVQDLYIEKINPENPDQYEYQGEWVDMEIVEETIHIAGADPAPLRVRYTRHGPIISDNYGPLEEFDTEAGIPLPERYAIAMRWTALEPMQLFHAILDFDQAQNWEDFRAAAQYFTAPAQNLVFADVDGNIGYQTPGNIPIRASGDGSLPVPGWTGEYEWEGYIPFDELPSVYNPEQGYIATANNAVVGPDYPYMISQVWDYGPRAQRIVDLIENAPGPIDVAYVKNMHGDNYNLTAARLTPYLLNLTLEDERLERARLLLQSWDYQDYMDSAPAALFAAFWKHLLADTFDDNLIEDHYPDGNSRWSEVMRNLAQQPDSAWWDDRATGPVESRDDIFLRAFTEAVGELERTQGGNPENWHWGDQHTLTFRNQSLGESGVAPVEALFNRGPFRTSGGPVMVNATAWRANRDDYTVRSLPSLRMIVDLSDLRNSVGIHTTGQSGHAYHPHYIDMADPWRNIQYYPMLWDRAQVESAADAHLRLLP